MTDQITRLAAECSDRRCLLASLAQCRGATNRQDGMVMATYDPEVSSRHDVLLNCQDRLREMIQAREGNPPEDLREALRWGEPLAMWWDKLPPSEVEINDLVDLHYRIRSEQPGISDDLICAMANMDYKKLYNCMMGRGRIPARYWVALRTIKGLSHCTEAHITALSCVAAFNNERINPIW